MIHILDKIKDLAREVESEIKNAENRYYVEIENMEDGDKKEYFKDVFQKAKSGKIDLNTFLEEIKEKKW